MIPASTLTAKCEPEAGTLDRPLDHLLACHRRIETRLETLQRAAAALASSPTEARQAIQNVLRFFDTNGLWHTQDEEESLFPRLNPRLDAESQAFLATLHTQHEQAEAAYAALKQALHAGDEATAATLIPHLAALYQAHIAAEDATLIPLGHQFLSPAELQAIAEEMKHRRGLQPAQPKER